MENKITIREAVLEQDIAAFWEQLHIYHKRDIFPGPDQEDLEYFLGEAYHDQIMQCFRRPQDRCFFLFFQRNAQEIGFAMPVIFSSEDGKCFIMEYCIYPPFRGMGLGKECAWALLHWAREHGARYAELNYDGSARRRHFWEAVGFRDNGADEWGERLMLLPPAEDIPITVELLSDPEDWQLKKLENGFLMEIGEPPSTEEKQAQLTRAILAGRITFFIAKRGARAVGMCSAVRCFSTYACADIGVFDDFYIEPAFRKKGIAGKLAKAAQRWCEANGLASLTVTCAPCDAEMYKALGFDARLGQTFAYLP